MKNIHLLPTDKPSRLWLSTRNENYLIFDKFPREYVEYVEPKNIYITSDEEIKEGDWYLDSLVHPLLINTPLKHSGIEHTYENGKIIIQSVTGTTSPIATSSKIILTADQDLIKDGVQEIDDEFLEWFVKNPRCEEIKIHTILHEHHFGFDKHKKTYKIIIPKEESTFYTKKCKCMIFEPNCFTGMCKNCGGILKEETKPKTMLEILQEYFKNTPKEKVLEDWNEFQDVLLEVVSSIDDHLTALANDDENFDNED